MLRTDKLTDSLPQKGTTMAKAPVQAPAPVPHHVAMGQAASSAMQHLSMSGMQQAIGDVSSFANPAAQQQDFTPRAYQPKPEPQG